MVRLFHFWVRLFTKKRWGYFTFGWGYFYLPWARLFPLGWGYFRTKWLLKLLLESNFLCPSWSQQQDNHDEPWKCQKISFGAPRQLRDGELLFETLVEFIKCWGSGRRSQLFVESVNGPAFMNFSTFLRLLRLLLAVVVVQRPRRLGTRTYAS